jgi:predicted RNA-binding Zn ribbon-like protein
VVNGDTTGDFRFDYGATWLNLLATRDRAFGPNPIERLDSDERLAQWLRRSELSPLCPPSPDDLDLTLRMRETLRGLALATVVGEPPPDEAVEVLADFLDERADPVRLLAHDRLRRKPPDTVADALARITRQAVEQLTGIERTALKSCPERDCRGLFSDPEGRRRWCPSPACASRGRVRALRARRAAARLPPGE